MIAFVFRALRVVAFLVLAICVSAPLHGSAPAQAQQQAQQQTVLTKSRQALAQYASRAQRLQDRMAAAADDDAALVEVRGELEALNRDLLATSQGLSPRLAEINARLEQIGAPPAEGQPPEPAGLTTERNALQAEKSEINTLLGEAEALSVRVSGLVDRVAQLRRDLFSSQLSKRYDISAALNTQTLTDFRDEVAQLYDRFASWIRFAVGFKLGSLIAATFFSLAAAVLLLIGGRRTFGNLINADPLLPEPSYLSRLSVAFWSTFLPSLSLAVFLLSTYFFLDYFNILRSDIAPILSTLFNVIATVYFVNRLLRAAFSPNLPNWRLVPVQFNAHKLFWLAWATSIVTGIDFVFNRINEVLNSPLSVTAAKSFVATIIVGVLVILFGRVKPFKDEEGRPRSWPRVLKYLFVGAGALTIVAALLGYIGLARFVSQQIVVTGAILATMYIGHLSAQAISDVGAFTQTAIGRRLRTRFSLDDSAEDQVGLAVSIITYALIVVIGIPLILLQWGFQWGDIAIWTMGVAREVRIGSVSFSLIGILTGIVVFVLGYFVTRWFQSWIDGSVMARGKVDAGVRNSIRTVVGYLGLAVAALVGVSAAGIDLSNFALIAGGLSLGIGFGLQNIVQNFVSGLILLAERPFKVGDWVVAGPISGNVRKISVRATEIETFQRQTVIVPNSEFINSAVGNWTHRNKLGRLDLKAFVAYGADGRRAQQLLIDIARAHPQVLRNPEPFVLFVNLSDVGMEFELRVFLADITSSVAVQNELRFQILETFSREGIVTPYAPRAFYPHDPDGAMIFPKRLEEEAPELATEGGEAEPEPEATPARRPRGRTDKV